MTAIEKLNSYHDGYVVKRPSQREKIRIITTKLDKKCACGAKLKSVKSVRYDKHNKIIKWECLKCYLFNELVTGS